jgi:hypothetical protein
MQILGGGPDRRPTASSQAPRRLGLRSTHSRAFWQANQAALYANQPGQLQRVVSALAGTVRADR